MLCEMIYLAIAIFYKKFNPELGRKILIQRWALDQIPNPFWEWFKSHEKKFQEQVQDFSSRGIQFTYPGCWDYPAVLLQNLESFPLLLTYLGQPTWSQRPNLGVVGSRKMSSITKEWMETELLHFLQRNFICLLSGGARGVDQAAHLCALRTKKPTYVFLPSGLEEIYPKDMKEWRGDILEAGGAFLSEYWPTEKLRNHYFIERNRLIAAMSDFILIVQGEKKSGTLLTAQWALDLGRDLGVLPGHPMDPLFSGNLHLVRSGVPMVMDSLDLEVLMK